MNAETISSTPSEWRPYRSSSSSVEEAREELTKLFNKGLIQDGYIGKDGAIRVKPTEKLKDEYLM